MKNKIIVIIILLGSNVIFSQLPLPNTNISNNIFTKTDKQFNKSKSISSIDYYPLNNGDFWEYNVVDTNTFSPDGFSQYIFLHFSETREVIGDTLMTNGITYKTIKWEKCANSVNESPRYEFQRNDTSGHVFIFFNGEDKLLYDLNINVGVQYPSIYSGFNWQLVDRYTVTGFGKNFNALDYVLKSSSGVVRKSITIIEDFGLTNYKGDVNGVITLPDGNFFGGIIKDSTYGYLLVKKQQIDWSEFYPLHVGDFWKYITWYSNSGITVISAKTVIKDTLINNISYKKVLNLGLNYTQGNSTYQRVKDNVVLSYNIQTSSDDTLRIFSPCLGDTISSFIPFSVWRVDDKDYETLKFFLYPDVAFISIVFKRGFGKYKTTGDLTGTDLIGAVINGVVYGDTTLTGIEEEKAGVITDYNLFQNYPNPFNPSTTIKYQIVNPGIVTLNIYDILGRKINTLVNQYQNAGRYNVTFNAKGLSSGVYIYVLKSGNYLESKKLILLK
ncbi:MAG: T9SS type A sorting domain-containing protein [Bacteroidetes bacterium]|nr:T9SS type A sorting domain-containing protein [Bacteroidota bacterium]